MCLYQKKIFFEHPSVYDFNSARSRLKIKKTLESNFFKSQEDLTLLPHEISPELFDRLKENTWVAYE